MKKNKIFIIIIIILLSFLVYNVISKIKQKNEISKQLQTIPKFELKTLDNLSFSNANLKENTSTIFIYFNSECDYCQHEAESISQNLNKFKDVEFIFVSTEKIKTIKQFLEKYNLNNQPNITFLYDRNFLFTNQFDANSIPYILIYDRNKALLKKHKGQLNANGILRILNEKD